MQKNKELMPIPPITYKTFLKSSKSMAIKFIILKPFLTFLCHFLFNFYPFQSSACGNIVLTHRTFHHHKSTFKDNSSP